MISHRILKLNPDNDTVTIVGDDLHVEGDGIHLCLGPWWLPSAEIDAAHKTHDSIVLEDLLLQFIGCVLTILGNDGCIYCPPGAKFDPEKK